MFMGYSLDRWIGLGEYLLIVLILSIFALGLSCILANKSLHTNKRKNNFKSKKTVKKSYFIDVA